MFSFFFFFNDTATTEIYTLSLHDALPIWSHPGKVRPNNEDHFLVARYGRFLERLCTNLAEEDMPGRFEEAPRSEEHTSELQSRLHLVCRLLLEKKKTVHIYARYIFDTSII